MSALILVFSVILFYTFISFSDGTVQWYEAVMLCKQKGQILIPEKLSNESRFGYRQNTTMWTSSYILSVNNVKHTALYVEQIPVTEVHRGLCINNKNLDKLIVLNTPLTYTLQDFKCAWDYPGSNNFPDSLLNITSLSVVKEVLGVMDFGQKYWLSGISESVYSLVHQCEVVNHVGNFTSSRKSNTAMHFCDEMNNYKCINGKNYRTAVSLVKYLHHRHGDDNERKKTKYSGGVETPLSWDEARRECKTKNKILSPLKSVQRNLKTHLRSIRSVWTSNYGLNLGCNISTGFCNSLYIEQIPKSEHYEGLCENDFSVTGNSKHFQIGSNDIFKRTCKRGIPVDIFDMSELGHAIKEMEVNTKYWINSTNIAIDSFVRHCMLYTKYQNRTGNYQHLTRTDCREKYPYMCTEDDSYGTVISRMTFLNNVDLTTQIVLKPNQSEVNSSEGGEISGTVTAITLTVGMLVIGLVVIFVIYRKKLSCGN